jgi:glycosyltransferase involved in cell wall biosynthesis
MEAVVQFETVPAVRAPLEPPGMRTPKVSVVIPALNEAGGIGELVGEIRRLHPCAEVIVVDDGSTDPTAAEAAQAGARVYRHPYNIGNGAAVKSGIRTASGDILVFMDGDGQHDPQDIQRFLDLFPDFDMVVGSRSLREQASLGRALGNRIYNWLGSYVTKFPVRDLTSGFRAVKADVARDFLYLLPNTYSYPTTLTLGVLRTGRSLKYIPIRAKARSRGKSGIRLFRDGARFFMIIIRICTLYSPMRVFLPVSFSLALGGLINYAFTFFTQGRFTNMSVLLLANAVIIFMMSLISEQICQMRFERRERRAPLQRLNAADGHPAADQVEEYPPGAPAEAPCSRCGRPAGGGPAA